MFFTRRVANCDNAWGNCLIEHWGNCAHHAYTKFGVEKIFPVGNQEVFIYRVLDKEAKQKFVALQFDYATGRYYAAEYDGNGNIVRKLDRVNLSKEYLEQEGFYIQDNCDDNTFPDISKYESASEPTNCENTTCSEPANCENATCDGIDY